VTNEPNESIIQPMLPMFIVRFWVHACKSTKEKGKRPDPEAAPERIVIFDHPSIHSNE
jgi:hypothetical protein